MRERDETYFARRAEEERRQSELARDPAAHRAHLELARAYERKASAMKIRMVQG